MAVAGVSQYYRDGVARVVFQEGKAAIASGCTSRVIVQHR